MNIHELKEMNFDEAIDLLETRLVDMRTAIEETRKKIEQGEYGADKHEIEARFASLKQDHAALEEKMEKLRELRAEALSGANDNFLTELLGLFDSIGERIEKLFE